MTVIVKTKTPLTVPETVQRRAGIKAGDRLEFKVSGGVIIILPKLPSADDEYTPEQRKIIDARLARGLADVKAGRMSKAYSGYGEFITHVNKAAAKYGKGKTTRRPAK